MALRVQQNCSWLRGSLNHNRLEWLHRENIIHWLIGKLINEIMWYPLIIIFPHLLLKVHVNRIHKKFDLKKISSKFDKPIYSRILTLPTIISGQVKWTLAIESICQIDTGGSRWARIFSAVNHIFVAVLASEPRRTDAVVASTIVHAGSSILTNISLACVKLVLATNTCEVSRAAAI